MDHQALINELNRRAKHIPPLDLEFIYGQLKDRYDLVLTNALSLDAGFSRDFPVLTGKSALGTFYLYYDALVDIFDVENKDGTASNHWHPADAAEAMRDIAEFMEGKADYELYPHKPQ